MVIRVLDHVARASSYADGDVIFEMIRDPIARGEPVTVSFEGVRAVPTAFVNAAFVRLAESLPVASIRGCLHLTCSTRGINRLVKDRFAFVEGASAESLHKAGGAHGPVAIP